MYTFDVITNDFSFLHDFAFCTGALIRVKGTCEDGDYQDKFELYYPDIERMIKAKECLNDVLHQR